jgi:hypothetical protein
MCRGIPIRAARIPHQLHKVAISTHQLLSCNCLSAGRDNPLIVPRMNVLLTVLLFTEEAKSTGDVTISTLTLLAAPPILMHIREGVHWD